jgi:hypothetical protein
MKSLFTFLVCLGISSACLADGEPVVFYAQLISATDRDVQDASWRPIGPKLSNRHGPNYRWKKYWEDSRQTLNVPPGKRTRVRLNPEREVEIELRAKGDSEIRHFNNGKLVHKTKQSTQSKMSIVGGTRENDESWFVVIRRDKPTID